MTDWSKIKTLPQMIFQLLVYFGDPDKLLVLYYFLLMQFKDSKIIIFFSNLKSK